MIFDEYFKLLPIQLNNRYTLHFIMKGIKLLQKVLNGEPINNIVAYVY